MNSGLRVFVRSKAPTPFGTEEETDSDPTNACS
jgi:hypothetical protein